MSQKRARLGRWFVAAACALVATFTAAKVRGQASATEHPWSAGALVGYGFTHDAQFGFGFRGGYTTPVNVYVGVALTYHVGTASTTRSSLNDWYFGAEAGYELALGPILIRPYAGIGDVLQHLTATNCQRVNGRGCVTTGHSRDNFGVWPGALVVYPFLQHYFVGADARYVFAQNVPDFFGLFATGGVRF